MKHVRVSMLAATLFLVIPRVFPQQAGPEEKRIRTTDYAALGRVPEKFKNKPNPLANDPDAVVAGRKLFQQHCAECHGPNASGDRRGPTLRATEVQQATAGALFWVITNGVVKQGMPVWSKLPEPQRWQIITFLKSLSASE